MPTFYSEVDESNVILIKLPFALKTHQDDVSTNNVLSSAQTLWVQKNHLDPDVPHHIQYR